MIEYTDMVSCNEKKTGYNTIQCGTIPVGEERCKRRWRWVWVILIDEGVFYSRLKSESWKWLVGLICVNDHTTRAVQWDASRTTQRTNSRRYVHVPGTVGQSIDWHLRSTRTHLDIMYRTVPYSRYRTVQWRRCRGKWLCPAQTIAWCHTKMRKRRERERRQGRGHVTRWMVQ